MHTHTNVMAETTAPIVRASMRGVHSIPSLGGKTFEGDFTFMQMADTQLGRSHWQLSPECVLLVTTLSVMGMRTTHNVVVVKSHSHTVIM